MPGGENQHAGNKIDFHRTASFAEEDAIPTGNKNLHNNHSSEAPS